MSLATFAHLFTDTIGTILLIDSLTGQERKKLYTKSHGIGVAKYTHHDACILLSSGR